MNFSRNCSLLRVCKKALNERVQLIQLCARQPLPYLIIRRYQFDAIALVAKPDQLLRDHINTYNTIKCFIRNIAQNNIVTKQLTYKVYNLMYCNLRYDFSFLNEALDLSHSNHLK